MSEIESRLGRIEGKIDMYTRQMTYVVDRIEKRQTRIEAEVVAVKVDNAKRTGMITMLSASLSGIVAVAITFFSKGA